MSASVTSSGTGYIDTTGECDLGMNNSNTSACTLSCLLLLCSDGFTQTDAGEQCDDSKNVNTDSYVVST